MIRSVLLGAGLALLLLLVGSGLLVSGVVEVPFRPSAPDRLLVIITAPDDGSLAAPIAFVLDEGTSGARLLDPSAEFLVSGTSARTARDAYPFVGGQGVARALTPQTDGKVLPWVVLPPETWADLVDDVDGIEAVIPSTISVYSDGSLVVLDEGPLKLTGRQAVASATALEYVQDEAAQKRLRDQLAAGVSVAVSTRPDILADLVSDGRARSLLTPTELGVFSRP